VIDLANPEKTIDAAKLYAAFFTGTSVRCNFICKLGCGDAGKLFARSPRLGFDECCVIA
jgi:hypothetical protein